MTSKSMFSKKQSINFNGKLYYFDKPWVMGILNVTPDSFYDGGKYEDEKAIIKRVQSLITEGADIIDIGAYSTRPGAEDISPEEEIKRLSKTLTPVREKYPDILISVDTFRSDIAGQVVEKYNVNLINDISGGTMDSNMFSAIAELQVPYVLMHIQGTPQTMQKKIVYEDLINDIMKFLAEGVQQLKLLGVNDIILDPGFGFGKTIDHNYLLLKKLSVFRYFDLPLMAGLSRKSMIYKILDIDPDDALNGTTALNTLALNGGADILRVHDVKAAKEIIGLMDKYKSV